VANNIDVKDATSTTVTIKTTDNASTHTPHHNIDTIAAGDNNIGNVDVASVALPSTFYMGQNTVTSAGTEEALASSQTLTSGVTVKALHANTGYIYVGTNPVTSTTGFVLDAGEQIFIEVDNLADVYIDCSVSGEGVSWLAS
jgi:hypothetical protein